ncbi:type II secretion system protein [Candidatus Daviesbacteria bacterium]|nr:type II secretion system protein [Candidatus Daviesbacteria bacterium]
MNGRFRRKTFVTDQALSKSVQVKNGFTLIETLLVVIIFATIGVILSGILSRTFRGSDKSQLIGTIKQNGQSALNVIDRAIRQADGVICPTDSTPAKIITIRTKASPSSSVGVQGSKYIRFRFVDPTASSNGFIVEEEPVVSNPSDEASLLILCSPSVGSYETPTYLTDRDTGRGVSVPNSTSNPGISDPYFKVYKQQGFKDIVVINFRLSPAINAGSSFEDKVGSDNTIEFQTTIELR